MGALNLRAVEKIEELSERLIYGVGKEGLLFSKILIDEKQMLLFYKGYPVQLPPTTFKLMLLLSKRPGQIVTRDEIYSSLYPDSPNSSRPYDRQTSDHKRKILIQIKKALKDPLNPNELRNLIKTRRKVGYVLNIKQENVIILN